MNGLLIGILKSILSSFDIITWKRALTLSNISRNMFIFTGVIGQVAVGLLFLLLGFSTISYDSLAPFLIILGIDVLCLIVMPIEQKIYAEEKLSVLAPYRNLSPILTIIIGFFIFSGQSIISFIMAFCAISIMIISSIDFKNISIPKNVYALLFCNIIWAIKNLLIGYLLTQISTFTYFTLNATAFFIISLIIVVFITKDIGDIKKIKKDFFLARLTTLILGLTSSVLGLFLIKGLGIVMSNLLGFLTLGTTLLFSYILFKDKPSKKDLLVTFIVFIFVGVGVYFK